MRVIHLLIGSQEGGAESFYMRLGSALHSRGVETLMVMSSNLTRQSYFDTLKTPYKCIDFDAVFGLWGRFRYKQIVNNYKPDIIVLWMDRAARRLIKGKHVNIGRVGGPYRMKHYKKCDAVVVNSEPLMEHVQRQGVEHAFCIPNFTNIEIKASRKKASGKPTLFFHGRLHEQKGLDVLINAMVDIEADLLIAGEGVEQNSLQGLAGTLGVAHKIKWLGWQTDISTYLNGADIYVFPSRYEGTSNSLLEAMAYAKPIVTTNGHSVDWFLEHEKNALIVNVDDSKELAKAINKLIYDKDYARRLGENAKKLFQDQFSEEVVCQQWIGFLEKHMSKA